MTEHAVVSGDEVTAVVAFETFLDLLEVPASWMGAFFPALVKLSVETASNTQLELNTREQALQVRPDMLLSHFLQHSEACRHGSSKHCPGGPYHYLECAS